MLTTQCNINAIVDGQNYPIIYRVLTIPGGAGFRPSTVLCVSHSHISNEFSSSPIPAGSVI